MCGKRSKRIFALAIFALFVFAVFQPIYRANAQALSDNSQIAGLWAKLDYINSLLSQILGLIPKDNLTAAVSNKSNKITLTTSGDASVVAGSPVSVSISESTASPQFVGFSLQGLPAGSTYSFTPQSCLASCSTSLTINTSITTPGGVYPIKVYALQIGGHGNIKYIVFNLTVISSVTGSPSTIPTSSIISTKFSIGDAVYVSSGPLNIRNKPALNGKKLGTQQLGAIGQIVGGPIFANKYWWWNIDYNSGSDGWSVENFLEKITQPTPTPTPTPSSTPTPTTQPTPSPTPSPTPTPTIIPTPTASPTPTPTGVIRNDVIQWLAGTSTAKVGLELAGTWKLDSDLSSTDAVVQRQALADVQNALLSLLGPDTVLLSKSKYGPFMSLIIDTNDLNILVTSNLVKDVYLEERISIPSLSQSGPLVGAVNSWNLGYDGTGKTIVIIDTGVDGTNPFLKNKILAEACFSVGGNCPNGKSVQTGPGSGIPCNFYFNCDHGTHVAGIAAGNGDAFTDFSGVAKGAKVIAINVAHKNICINKWNNLPFICIGMSDSDEAAALEFAYEAAQAYEISSVNMSLGSVNYRDQQLCDIVNPRIKSNIDMLRRIGIPTIISAGNDGTTNALNFPGCISSAVSVGATTKSDQIATYSNGAPFLSLLAPGGDGSGTSEDICSSTETGDISYCILGGPSGFEIAAGTSMAAPHVAGAWAILKQKNPTATVGQILNALQTTGKKIKDERNGSNGRINSRIQIDEAIDNIPEKIKVLPMAEAVAYGINNTGQIVGADYSTVYGDLWGIGYIADTMGSYNPITSVGPIESGGWLGLIEATAINNKDEVVGYWSTGYWGDRGFFRSQDGAIATVYTPEANALYGNNDFGDLVGSFWDPPPSAGQYMYVGGALTPLPNPPLDINNMTRVVGIGPQVNQGWVMDENGSRTIFSIPGSAWTYPFSINESGLVVGKYMDGSSNWHGFIRNPNGSLKFLDYPGAVRTSLYGVNDSRQIVGAFDYGSGSAVKAFIDLSW